MKPKPHQTHRVITFSTSGADEHPLCLGERVRVRAELQSSFLLFSPGGRRSAMRSPHSGTHIVAGLGSHWVSVREKRPFPASCNHRHGSSRFVPLCPALILHTTGKTLRPNTRHLTKSE